MINIREGINSIPTSKVELRNDRIRMADERMILLLILGVFWGVWRFQGYCSPSGVRRRALFSKVSRLCAFELFQLLVPNRLERGLELCCCHFSIVAAVYFAINCAITCN